MIGGFVMPCWSFELSPKKLSKLSGSISAKAAKVS